MKVFYSISLLFLFTTNIMGSDITSEGQNLMSGPPCDPIELPVNETCINTSATTLNAGSSEVPSPSCGLYAGDDVWFSFLVPASGMVRIETSSSGSAGIDTDMAIYSGACNEDLIELLCDDNSGPGQDAMIEALDLPVEQTLYIRVWEHNNSAVMNFNICVINVYHCPNLSANIYDPCDDGDPETLGDIVQPNCTCTGNNPDDCVDSPYSTDDPAYLEVITIDPYCCETAWDEVCESYINQLFPDNDLPCAAIELSCEGAVLSGSTEFATMSTLPAASCTGGNHFDLFYYVDAVPGLQYLVTVNGSNYDGILAAYSGECSNNLVEISCSNYYADDNGEENLIFSVGSEQRVYIRTYDDNENRGEFMISASCQSDLALLTGNINWNINCANGSGTIYFYQAGTSNLLLEESVDVNTNGNFIIATIPTGTYDVYIKINGYLQKGLDNISVNPGNNSLTVGNIVAGDLNNDNNINIADISILNAAFNSSIGDSNYNSLADLNCNGTINIADVSLINAGFGSTGDSVN